MSFRLLPNSVTLDDLEQRNCPNCSVISPNSVISGQIRNSGWRYTNTFSSKNV